MRDYFDWLRDSANRLLINQTRLWYDRNPGFSEIFLGWSRLLLAFLMLLMYILVGGQSYQSVDARSTAIQFRNISPLLHLIPLDFIAFIVYVFNWQNLRYAFPIIGALISVLLAGAFYVKDIYNLKQIPDALRYVLSSMFAVHYPQIRIDNGQKEIARKETNLIDAIGGPGYALIQPGNAVLFSKLRQVSRNIITQSVLMTRFETIGPVTNLDDQDGYVEDMQVISRDGIQIRVRDIRFRYRILSETVDGRPVVRSEQNPYPFSRRAFIDLSYYLAVNEQGLVSWGQSVKGVVLGVIEDYIASHTVDYLTAPRNYQRDPRQEVIELIFGPGLTAALRNAGTKLLWVDIGHFDIIAEDVDRERINLWAADWEGDAEVMRAESEAKRMAYQELGRSEGQAEMLMGIAQALQSIDLNANHAQNVRHVLLARTAQILEAMRDNRPENPQSGGGAAR